MAALLSGMGVLHAPPAQAAVAAKIAPAAAQVGTGVTVSGEGLAQTSAVTFLGAAGPEDDVVAPNFIALDAKKVMVQVPPGVESGPIELTTPAGAASTGAVVFTLYKAPVISALSTSQGKPADPVVITGDHLMGAKKPKVMVGTKTASLVTATQTELSVKVPTGLPGGPTTLQVITTGGTARHDFYIAPLVGKLAPVAGTTVGGTVASIGGAGFTGVDAFTDDPGTPAVDESLDGVTIGGVRVTELIAVNDKEVVVRVPAGVDAAAPVVVSTTDGTTVASSNATIKFGYQPIPVVTAASQNWNLLNDPAPIVYTGINFAADTIVKVGSVVVPAVFDDQAGTLTVTPPVGLKPAVTAVSFINMFNGKAYVATSPFAHIAAPTVAKLSVLSGPTGTTVLVTGTGFASGTTAAFGATPADCAIVSFVLLRCTSPAGSGQVDVTVTNPVGTSATTAATKFTHTAGTAPAAAVVGTPSVAALAPAYGATGSTVDIKGANLAGVTKVEFPGPDATWVNAPDFLVVGPGRISVTVPAGVVTGQLRLTWSGGTVISTNKRYTSTVRPEIQSIDVVGDNTYMVTPGDLLKIRGVGLLIKGAKTEVTIGGKAAPILAKPIPTSKTLVVKVPAAVGGREAVVLKNPLGASSPEQLVYYGPEIKAIKPASWSRTGGTVATIAGGGFWGADNVTIGDGRLGAVTLDGAPVAKMVQVSDKMLVISTAPGSATMDDLIVTTQHDTKFATSEGKIRSVDIPIPQISTVSPGSGPSGSQAPNVTITGQKLLATSTVKFGTQTATVVSAAPDGTSMVVTPPVFADPATVTVTVTNIDEGDAYTDTLVDGYSYELQPAIINAMSHTTALAGSSVTLTGSGFVDVTSVKFGTVEAAYSVANPGTILATVPATPAGAPGTMVQVTVTNGTGQPSTANPTTANDWTWDASPTITSISPPVSGQGTTVTISGANFVGVTRVRFGWTDATSYTVVDPNTITAVVPVTPAGQGGQTVDVVVEVGAFVSIPSSPPADNFTWIAPAVITAMNLHTGPQWTQVTVTGTGFSSMRTVTIHTKAVIAPSVVSDTQLTFFVPATDASGPMSAGNTRDVRITNGSGAVSTATPSTADDWTFQ